MSKVSRSTYQKVKEENKRLLRDIKILVGPNGPEKGKTMLRYMKKFKEEEDFHNLMKKLAQEYLSSEKKT